MSRRFLDADVKLGQPAAAAAVFFGHVDAEETRLAQLLPQCVRLLALVDDILEIFPPKLAHELADRVAQIAVVVSGVAERGLEQFGRHFSSLQSFGPFEEALARFGAKLSFADHIDQYLGRREAVAVRGLQCARDIEADVEPDNIAQSQWPDRMAIGQHRRAVDILGARDAALEHAHRLKAGDEVETTGGKAGNIAHSERLLAEPGDEIARGLERAFRRLLAPDQLD